MTSDRRRPDPRTLVLAVLAALTPLAALADEPTKPKAPAQPTRTATPAAKDAGPIVVSTAKAGRRGSEFLSPPGTADRYDPESADWRDVPPWRQTSFFGVRARGQFFVYVVDCSGSMVDEDRLARAKEQLRASIRGLTEPQRFHVIFYNDEPIGMPGGMPRSASLASKEQLLAWLRLIEPDGGTDPGPALGTALSLRPDAVFLLSDGEFPTETAELVSRKNVRKIPIHCIDLGDGETGDQLRRIARQSGGRYVMRPWQGP